MQIWVLCDINAAYVSFCELFNPQYRGMPLGVLSSNQGCVIARNQAIKDLGVKMADPAFTAAPLIKKHGGHLWGSNFTLFGDMSQRFHSELELLIIEAERYSVDEAFGRLDTTCMPDLRAYSFKIRDTIQQNLGLSIGVGVGRSRTLAKSSSWGGKEKKWKHKTGGVVVLDSPDKETWLLSRQPVGSVWGIGRQTAAKLERQAIRTAAQLRDSDLKSMQHRYGVVVERTILELRGIEAIELKDASEARIQICVSRSMGISVETINILNEALASHADDAARKLRKQGSWCGKITVFVGTNPFQTEQAQYHNSLDIVLPRSTQSTHVITQYASFLLDKLFKTGFNYRKTGIVLSRLTDQAEIQGDLFAEECIPDNAKINQAFDLINDRFGKGTIKLGAVGFKNEWKPRDNLAPPSYTTDINSLPVAK